MSPERTDKLLLEYFIVSLIVVLPFTLYFHLFFEDNSDTLHFFGFRYHHGLAGNEVFIWLLIKKTIPIILFFIWFLMAKFWWRYFILSPILVYIYSFVQLFTVTTNYPSDYRHEFIYPSMGVVAFLVMAFFFGRSFRTFYSFNTYKTPYGYLAFSKKAKSFLKSIENYLSIVRLKENESNKILTLQKLFHSYKTIEDKFALSQKNANNKIKSAMRSDMLIIVIHLVIPFIFHLSAFVPGGIQAYKLWFLTFDSNGFNDVNTSVWYLTRILSFLLPLIIWFITERRWWRYAILSPIILSCYQIWEGFYQSAIMVDEVEYFKSFPFIIIIVFALLLLSYFMRFQYHIFDLYDRIIIEIEELAENLGREEMSIDDKKLQLKNLKERSKKENAIKDLMHLLRLKKKLSMELTKLKR